MRRSISNGMLADEKRAFRDLAEVGLGVEALANVEREVQDGQRNQPHGVGGQQLELTRPLPLGMVRVKQLRLLLHLGRRREPRRERRVDTAAGAFGCGVEDAAVGLDCLVEIIRVAQAEHRVVRRERGRHAVLPIHF